MSCVHSIGTYISAAGHRRALSDSESTACHHMLGAGTGCLNVDEGLQPLEPWQECRVHAAYMRARQMRSNPELKDPRAIMLLAYQHQEPPMRLPKRISGAPSPLMVAMRAAIKAGLEIWQVSAASCCRWHHEEVLGLSVRQLCLSPPEQQHYIGRTYTSVPV